MKFLKQASMLRLCVAIGMMMIGITGCKPKITPAAVYYTVTLQVSGAEGGTLKAMINNKPVETGSETNIPVLSGTKITMTARPREGYNIGAWTGTTVGTGAATAEIVITKDSSVTVKFIKKPAGGGSPNPSTPNQTQEYTVTFSVKDNTGGTLTATANGKNLENETKVKAGTKVRFTATPKSAEGYTVGTWTGTDTPAGTGAVELIITQDVNVTVGFVKITRYGTITFGASEGGSISATVKIGENTEELQSGGTAPYGSIVTFTAIPEDGYVFDRWEGLTDAPSEGTATYTVTGDRYVKAYFKNAALPYLAVNFEREAWTVSFLGDDSRKKELKGKVIIPEWINGMHITRIGKFENCTEITEVVLPESITSIISFSGCQKLTKIAFPQSIKEIGSFAGCISLTTIELPQSVESIVNFSNCENLQTINIPHNKKLHYCPSFRMCKKLKKLYLPKNIISITEYAFMGCTSLELYLPKSIKDIGQCAFGDSNSSENSSVKTVYLPQSLSYEEKREIRRLIHGGSPKSYGEYDDTQPIP